MEFQVSQVSTPVQDPSGTAMLPGAQGAAAARTREAAYPEALSLAASLATQATSSPPARDNLARVLSAAAARADSAPLQHALIQALVAQGYGRLLVALAPQNAALERHLLSLGAPRPYSIPWAQLAQQVCNLILNGSRISLPTTMANGLFFVHLAACALGCLLRWHRRTRRWSGTC